MDPVARRSEINRITERVIACVYRVSNTLGSGFLEKIYENALAIELRALLVNFGRPRVEVKRFILD